MSGARPGQESGDLLLWTRYFDQLDEAMHDFEVGLSRHDVQPLRLIQPPYGRPPEILNLRWDQARQRIGELEFRARMIRKELRAEFARLHGSRGIANLRSSPEYGPSLDVSG